MGVTGGEIYELMIDLTNIQNKKETRIDMSEKGGNVTWRPPVSNTDFEPRNGGEKRRTKPLKRKKTENWFHIFGPEGQIRDIHEIIFSTTRPRQWGSGSV